MIVADTSVWIGFWRGAAECRELADLLTLELVHAHPWVTGELLLGGHAHDRLADIDLLEQAPIVDLEEQRRFVRVHHLWHRRVGWVDTQLLASCRVSALALWTRDQALAAAAQDLGVAFAPG